jgi:hypothetical protein
MKEDVELERRHLLEVDNGGKESMFASESRVLSSTGVIKASSSSSHSSKFVIWYNDEGGSVPKTLGLSRLELLSCTT